MATAAPEGRVNMSPKGLDSLRVVNDKEIHWLSLSGSGNETAAHVLANQRMTLMFCVFNGDAMILRVYAVARIVMDVCLHARIRSGHRSIEWYHPGHHILALDFAFCPD